MINQIFTAHNSPSFQNAHFRFPCQFPALSFAICLPHFKNPFKVQVKQQHRVHWKPSRAVQQDVQVRGNEFRVKHCRPHCSDHHFFQHLKLPSFPRTYAFTFFFLSSTVWYQGTSHIHKYPAVEQSVQELRIFKFFLGDTSKFYRSSHLDVIILLALYPWLFKYCLAFSNPLLSLLFQLRMSLSSPKIWFTIEDLKDPPTSFSHPRISSAYGRGLFTA